MNTITTKRHPRRSDEEWLSIIQECRTSGLSDKRWCEDHGIAPSKLYYHIRRLTKKTCDVEIPKNPWVASRETHEVVPLTITDEIPPNDLPRQALPMDTPFSEVAIRCSIHGISVEIFNHAQKDIILHTLDALQTLC